MAVAVMAMACLSSSGYPVRKEKTSLIYTGRSRPYTFRVGLARRPDSAIENGNTESKNGVPFQEDLPYLWKLLAGSVGSAALIKYGTAIYPNIANPNLLEAILMISVPVFVSIALLFRQSTLTEK